MSAPAPTGEQLRLLRAGSRGILVEVADPLLRRRLHQSLLRSPAPGTVELVPAHRTVLVQVATPGQVPAAVEHLRRLAAQGFDELTATADEVTAIEVRYDGEDLPAAAEMLGLGADELVRRHTGQLWTVEFAGFMPGFGYLSGDDWGFRVPRLASPRTRIPAGSVALADDFTGVYPQVSPGGWQLIGTTDAPLWELGRTPPALLTPGARIQFVAVR